MKETVFQVGGDVGFADGTTPAQKLLRELCEFLGAASRFQIILPKYALLRCTYRFDSQQLHRAGKFFATSWPDLAHFRRARAVEMY
jgi:hypothetical protein